MADQEQTVDRIAKQQELDRLRASVARIEQELQADAPDASSSTFPPDQFYDAWYLMTGSVLGLFAAIASLLANVVAAPLAGKDSLELIKVYLTFPMGEKALSLTSADQGLALAVGCCLYLTTGILLGIPVYYLLVKFCGTKSTLIGRLIWGSILALAVWGILFYGILSWLQPMLFGGRWIVDPEVLPPWVAIATHLVFGWTLALLYPWGLFRPHAGLHPNVAAPEPADH